MNRKLTLECHRYVILRANLAQFKAKPDIPVRQVDWRHGCLSIRNPSIPTHWLTRDVRLSYNLAGLVQKGTYKYIIFFRSVRRHENGY